VSGPKRTPGRLGNIRADVSFPSGYAIHADLIDASGNLIRSCFFGGYSSKRDAERAVKDIAACNAHDGLVAENAALREALGCILAWWNDRVPLHNHNLIAHDVIHAAITKARAALAKWRKDGAL
jgi:hypothetical protein